MAFDTSLTAGMDAIKSGSAFSTATSALSDMSAVSATLPADVAATLAASQANLAATISASTATLSRDMGVAATSIALQNKLAFAASGFPASDSVLAAAAGPVSVLSQGPGMLADQAKAIAAKVGEYASHFGASITSAMSESDKAKAAGAAMTAFVASIPTPKELPNPLHLTNPEAPATIPNPVYTEFATDPANIEKMGHLESASSAVTGIAASGEASLKSVAAAGAAALAEGIATIKSMSTMALLVNPAPAILVAALNNVVDYTKVSVKDITAGLNKSVPSVPTVMPGPPTA